jgi:hypothetical protein
MNTYTWEDWKDLKSFLNIDFEPRIKLNSADEMIRYWLSCRYGGGGDSLESFLFNVPLIRVPLYINTVQLTAQGPILIRKAAEWRLKLGK